MKCDSCVECNCNVDVCKCSCHTEKQQPEENRYEKDDS